MRHRIATVLAIGAAVVGLSVGTATMASATPNLHRGDPPAPEVCDTGLLGTGLLGANGELITECGLIPDLLGSLNLGGVGGIGGGVI